jgi:hypothetical protein
MGRVVLVATLKPEARDRALELLAANEPPRVVDRMGVFLSDREVVFFLEGPDVETVLREHINDPVRSSMLSSWLPLFDGPLHKAYESYFAEDASE